MSVDTFQAFFAILALVALAGVVFLLLALALRRRAAWAADVVAMFSAAALPLAWLVASVSTLGSLYFSEIADFIPCTLCWYQRIAMYPLAVILGIATFRRDRGIRRYAVPVAAIGLVISAYHWLIERYPDLEAGGTCSVLVPCTAPWFTEFGFVTLAFMAFCGFAFIIVTLLLPRPQEH
jgi:disulfide bond formation protein DsbB